MICIAQAWYVRVCTFPKKYLRVCTGMYFSAKVYTDLYYSIVQVGTSYREYREFDRRHFLENGLQNRNKCRKGYNSHYITYFGLYLISYTSYTNYLNCFCFRFAWILELQITCGRTNALISPDRLKPWAISFVQPCVLVG